ARDGGDLLGCAQDGGGGATAPRHFVILNGAPRHFVILNGAPRHFVILNGAERSEESQSLRFTQDDKDLQVASSPSEYFNLFIDRWAQDFIMKVPGGAGR